MNDELDPEVEVNDAILEGLGDDVVDEEIDPEDVKTGGVDDDGYDEFGGEKDRE